jgi:hypothetical protein
MCTKTSAEEFRQLRFLSAVSLIIYIFFLIISLFLFLATETNKLLQKCLKHSQAS